jgi:hypothetical protein
MILYKAVKYFIFDLALNTLFDNIASNFGSRILSIYDEIRPGDHFTSIRKGSKIFKDCTITNINKYARGMVFTIYFMYRNIDGDLTHTIILDTKRDLEVEFTI